MLHIVTNQIAGIFDTTGIDYEDGYVRIHPMNTDVTAKEATIWNPCETNRFNVFLRMIAAIIEMSHQNGISEGITYWAEPTLSN